MNYGDLKFLASEIGRFEGQCYLDPVVDAARFLALCNEQLVKFCTDTQVLNESAVAFTPIVGTRRYSIQGAQFAKKMVQIRAVQIDNGYWLREISGEEAFVRFPRYATAANARPVSWWPSSQDMIDFNCPFDQAYTCFVAGSVLHPVLVDDSTNIILQDDNVRTLAKLIAAELVWPHDKAAGEQLRGVALRDMEDVRRQALKQGGGRNVRGTLNPSTPVARLA
jgi:hypothetical protein